MTISPPTFFRAALALPLMAPFALLPVDNSVKGAFAVIAMASLLFGGVQYLVFAAVMFVLIGRCRDAWAIQKLSFVAPLLFIPIQALGWFLYVLTDYLRDPNIAFVSSLSGIPAFAAYSLIIGYLYVALANLVFAISRYFGWVAGRSA